jgi:putative aldouronate transport system permease protein
MNLLKPAANKTAPDVYSDKKTFLKKVYQNRILLAMLIPATVFVIVFSYIPMTGLILAFKNYNYSGGIYGSPWAGLTNFQFLIISNKLWPLIRNTLLYNFAFIVFGMMFQIGLAVLISELGNRYFKKAFQSFIFLPYFISWVVVAAIAQNVFSYEYGVFNKLLEIVGMERINIYEQAAVWPYLLVFFKVWKDAGYGMVIYMAAITNIDQEIYEAAKIDGANIWQRTYHITIAGLVPTMVIMFLLAVGQIFRGDFGLFYQLVGNNGQVLAVADILDLFVYRALSSTGDVGMASAAGLFQSLLCFATIMTVNFIIKKVQPEYTLF